MSETKEQVKTIPGADKAVRLDILHLLINGLKDGYNQGMQQFITANPNDENAQEASGIITKKVFEALDTLEKFAKENSQTITIIKPKE